MTRILNAVVVCNDGKKAVTIGFDSVGLGAEERCYLHSGAVGSRGRRRIGQSCTNTASVLGRRLRWAEIGTRAPTMRHDILLDRLDMLRSSEIFGHGSCVTAHDGCLGYD